MVNILRAITIAFVVAWSTFAGAQGPGGGGPGPSPSPNPWTVNGSTIFYNGCITVPSSVTGGCQGNGTINATNIYVQGSAVSGVLATAPIAASAVVSGARTLSLNIDSNFSVVTNNLALASGGVAYPAAVPGGAQGAGTINAAGLYVNGVAVTGAGITSLNTDVVATGPGAAVATIQAGVVTYAKFQTVAASSIIGNPTAGLATSQAISLGATLAFSGTALQTGAGTGDISWSANSFSTTLATVNSNVGTFGSATQSVQFTVNGKGLITAAANVTVTPAVGSITGLGTGVATALGNTAGGAGGFALVGTTPPTGAAGGSLAGTYPNPSLAAINSIGTSLAIGGATIGSKALAVTGTAEFSGNVTAPQLVSNIATGTAPLIVSSTTVVPNLYVARAQLADVASAVAVGNITGLGTGVATALGVNVGSAGAFVTFNGAGGTPSSMVGTNITGTAAGLTAGNVTTNANLTGPITSVGNATSIASQTGTGTTFVVNTGPTISALVVTGSFTATGLVTNAALANPATTVNGQTCTLGSTCTVTAAAGTLTGTTLNATVVTSSLTSVGALAGGSVTTGFTVEASNVTWSGTVPAANLPLVADASGAPSATFGIMKCDGTTTTCASGVVTSIGGAATDITVGTTTVSGSTNGYILFNNSGVLGGKNFTGTGNVVLDTAPTIAGATVSGTANFTGTFQKSGNTMTFPGAAATLTQTVASGAKALATGAIASAACTTAQTDTATGTATTDAIAASFNADPTAVTGYVPLTTGMLTIIAYPTTNTVNFKVCNNTGSSITPGAITINWRVMR